MKSKLLLFCTIIAFAVISAFISFDPLGDKITRALDTFSSRFPVEKVYLQSDKDYYAGGETIWFKGYITSRGFPITENRNLYVELIDQKGKIVQRALLPVNSGGANGDFELPEDFPPGNYVIRAYTAWMMNFDPAFLFRKDIRVYGPKIPAAGNHPADTAGNNVTAHPSVQNQFAVQFFPEGGDLVEGLQSVIAFKAIDAGGMPIKVEGKVVDREGREIAKIMTVHDGMGSFELTPETGDEYRAVILQSDGSTKSFPLPVAKPAGIVLRIYNTGNGRVFFHLERSTKDSAVYNRLRLVAQMQNQLRYMAPINFDEGDNGGMIPVNQFPSGIMQITVFREDGTPLAERLAFVENDSDRLKLSLHPVSLSIAPRTKNTFSLTVPDAIKGDFSVSVTDADQSASFPEEGNILSSLLLTSDIKGYVSNPGWYFKDRDAAAFRALDLVMMTNGWRRFEWSRIMNGRFPGIRYPMENGIEIRGRALEKNGRQAMMSGNVSMILKAPADSLTYFISTPVNQSGDFEVTGLHFHDTASVYYQGIDAKRKLRDVQVRFFNNAPAGEEYVLLGRPIRPPVISPGTELAHFLTLSAERNRVNRLIASRTIYLKEVNITATKVPKEQSTLNRYASPLFAGGEGYTFDLTKDPAASSYFNIFQFLQSRVPGLLITGAMGEPRLSWRGGSPALFLDEMPVDAGMLSSVNINDVALVRVLRPPFVGAFGGGGNGAIAVYTKKGGDNNDLTARGFDKTLVPGYTIVRQFYSPDYAVKKPVNELPDKRVTLYWNPSLKTDSLTHSATFSFYNNDMTRRFRVVVEGMDSEGRIGRTEQVFQ